MMNDSRNYLGKYAHGILWHWGKAFVVSRWRWQFSGLKRGWGGRHKGSLFGLDKSGVSFWIFNILQGTQQSYSSLVSGSLARRREHREQRFTKWVCCIVEWLFRAIAEWFAWVAPTKPGKSICEEMLHRPDVPLLHKKKQNDPLVLEDHVEPKVLKVHKIIRFNAKMLTAQFLLNTCLLF